MQFLMAQWLSRASRGHKCTVPDLEGMGLNPGQVKLMMHAYGTSVSCT